MTPKGTAPREKIGHSRVAKEQRIYCVRHWSVYIRSKYNYSTSALCARDIRRNFSSSRRRCIPSSEMDVNWQRQLLILPISCSKIKEDNRRKKSGGIRVMLITLESVGLWWMVWVLSRTSLTLMVQRSTQHHKSTASRLTHPSRSTAKPLTVQP